MNIEITKGFTKKAEKLPVPVKKQLQSIIRSIQEIDDLMRIPGSKRLKSDRKDVGKYYRIRLGDYRIGIELTGNTVKLVTVGDRKEIYRNFP